ncbi:hypothetical protein ACFE04_003833 [Oxalis oulophora]
MASKGLVNSQTFLTETKEGMNQVFLSRKDTLYASNAVLVGAQTEQNEVDGYKAKNAKLQEEATKSLTITTELSRAKEEKLALEGQVTTLKVALKLAREDASIIRTMTDKLMSSLQDEDAPSL